MVSRSSYKISNLLLIYKNTIYKNLPKLHNYDNLILDYHSDYKKKFKLTHNASHWDNSFKQNNKNKILRLALLTSTIPNRFRLDNIYLLYRKNQGKGRVKSKP